MSTVYLMQGRALIISHIEHSSVVNEAQISDPW